MIRPEIEHFIKWVNQNEDKFIYSFNIKYGNSEHSGITNNLYDITGFAVRDNLNNIYLNLNNNECEKMTLVLNYFHLRDISHPKLVKENELLKKLGSL